MQTFIETGVGIGGMERSTENSIKTAQLFLTVITCPVKIPFFIVIKPFCNPQDTEERCLAWERGSILVPKYQEPDSSSQWWGVLGRPLNFPYFHVPNVAGEM